MSSSTCLLKILTVSRVNKLQLDLIKNSFDLQHRTCNIPCNNSMKFEGKKSPRGPQRDSLLRIKGKSIAFDQAFLGGSSNCS